MLRSWTGKKSLVLKVDNSDCQRNRHICILTSDVKQNRSKGKIVGKKRRNLLYDSKFFQKRKP